jgi:UDP-glucose 4-epimerase
MPTDSKQVLVCGGAGYIGAHMCKALARPGHLPVVLDNFSSGHRWAVECGALIECGLRGCDALTPVSDTPRIAAVVHEANGSRFR